jgi:hypothetical protein
MTPKAIELSAGHAGIAAPRYHGNCITPLHHPEGFADGVGTSGAGRHRSGIRSVEVMGDGHVTRAHVVDEGGQVEGIDPFALARLEAQGLGFDIGGTPQRGANHHPYTGAVEIGIIGEPTIT